jgi:hypothetical protein
MSSRSRPRNLWASTLKISQNWTSNIIFLWRTMILIKFLLIKFMQIIILIYIETLGLDKPCILAEDKFPWYVLTLQRSLCSNAVPSSRFRKSYFFWNLQQLVSDKLYKVSRIFLSHSHNLDFHLQDIARYIASTKQFGDFLDSPHSLQVLRKSSPSCSQLHFAFRIVLPNKDPAST